LKDQVEPLKKRISELAFDLHATKANEKLLQTLLSQSKEQISDNERAHELLEKRQEQLIEELQLMKQLNQKSIKENEDSYVGSEVEVENHCEALLEMKESRIMSLQNELEVISSKYAEIETLRAGELEKASLDRKQLLQQRSSLEIELERIKLKGSNSDTSDTLNTNLVEKEEAIEILRERNFDLEEKIATLSLTLENYQQENALFK